MLVNTYKLFILLGSFILWINLPSAPAQVWSLQQCIDTALVYNKGLHIQRNNIEISNQKRREVKNQLMPKLNVNADYRYFPELPYQLMPMSVFGGQDGKFKEVQFGVPHNINANIQLSAPLYNPQVHGAVQATDIATSLSNLQMKKNEEQVYFDISNLYYNAQILTHQIQFADSNLSNTNRLLKNMQLLQQQLLATGTDVNKVALQADQLTTQIELLKSKKDQVLLALQFAMGISTSSRIEINPDIEDTIIDDYIPKPIIHLQVIKAQNRLLKSDLSTLKKSSYPSVALFGTYGTNGFGYDKSPNGFLKFHPMSFAGIQITYPLFDGNVLRRKRNQKEIELKNNELQQQLIVEQNSMETENAANQKRVAQQSVKSSARQIKQAQSIYDQTIMRQKEGIATLNDVLMADASLREAQQNYLTAIISYLKADLELKKLTGNLSN
ncbi:MAG: TolC family protein [Chitinophagaceae bacterium]|nr:TolC family protein [Chitinophagaceae bacterium]